MKPPKTFPVRLMKRDESGVFDQQWETGTEVEPHIPLTIREKVGGYVFAAACGLDLGVFVYAVVEIVRSYQK